MLKKTLLGLALVAGTTFGAEAATVTYATGYSDVVLGAGTGGSRNNPGATLGAPDGAFHSLGLGGSIVLTFGSPFVTPGTIWEVTFGNPAKVASYPEALEIFATNDGVTWTSVASVVNSAAQTGYSFTFAGMFTALKFVDTTASVFPGGPSLDGFDIDAVSVAAVPVPAAGLLLGGALAGMAALRRRARKA